MICKVDHLTINIRSLEQSVHFYRDILGLPLLESIDMGDHTLTYLEMPGGIKLELISYSKETGTQSGDCTKKGMIRHFAFEVQNLKDLIAALQAEKCNFHMEMTYVEKLRSYRILVEDPNGVELEFIEN